MKDGHARVHDRIRPRRGREDQEAHPARRGRRLGRPPAARLAGTPSFVSAIRKKLTEKARLRRDEQRAARGRFWRRSSKKTGHAVPDPQAKSFEEAGKRGTWVGKLVTVKGGKMVAHDAVLKDALVAVGGVF